MFEVLTAISILGTLWGVHQAGQNADAARAQAREQMIANREAAREKASMDANIARQQAEMQATIAREQAAFNTQNALAQHDMQQAQLAMAKEQIARQQFENEKLRIEEKRAQDELFYKKALQTSIRNERAGKITARDTILTSPLGIIGSSQPGQVAF